MDNYYYIPANYMDGGYILNGRFPKRNAIEAVVLGVIGFLGCRFFAGPLMIDTISIYIFVCLPLLLLGAAGIQGDPLSVYLMNAYKWFKYKKPYFFNNHGVAYRISAAQLIIDEPTFRDVLTDKWDQLKQSMRSPRIEYEEGVNFVFAEDPEEEALKAAEERLIAEEDQQRAEAEKASYNGTQPLTGADSGLDVVGIADHIVLHDVGEDENG